MRKHNKKLVLSHETLRTLSVAELANVAGGKVTDSPVTDGCLEKMKSKLICDSMACQTFTCQEQG